MKVLPLAALLKLSLKVKLPPEEALTKNACELEINSVATPEADPVEADVAVYEP